MTENRTLLCQDFSPEKFHVEINERTLNERTLDIIASSNALEGSNKYNYLSQAITLMDLTSLGATDTASTIENLCVRAFRPGDITRESNEPLCTAAVCVYPLRVEDADKSLKKLQARDKIFICSVAAGFPSGQYPLETRLGEIRYAIEKGADEIDVVINRSLAASQEWEKLYEELIAMRMTCGNTRMKTILATGELATLNDIYKASMVAMMAGSDFVKTSTGKEAVNATLTAGLVMCKAIKDYYAWTGRKVGFKPAGGIKTAADALKWMILVKEELGDEWLNKNLLRIGASSLLNDVLFVINSK